MTQDWDILQIAPLAQLILFYKNNSLYFYIFYVISALLILFGSPLSLEKNLSLYLVNAPPAIYYHSVGLLTWEQWDWIKTAMSLVAE